jgi:hypothetical protein
VHEVEDVHAVPRKGTGDAAYVAPGASATFSRTTLEGAFLSSLSVAGTALVQSSLLTGSPTGIDVARTGQLRLEYSTVTDNSLFETSTGVDNTEGGKVSIAHSIVWGNPIDLANVPCRSISWSVLGTAKCKGTNISDDPLFLPGQYCSVSALSPVLEHGPDPAQFSGEPCLDLTGAPRLQDHDGDGLARVDPGACEAASLDLDDVLDARWIGEQTLVWLPQIGATSYHVYRDGLAALAYSAFGSCRDDLDSDRLDTVLTDSETPPPGEAFFYLITAEAGGPSEGSLGLGTCAERSNFATCLP